MKRPPYLFTIALLMVAQAVFAADKAPKPRILFLTQSKGFTHGSVRRSTSERSPAELAMMQLAQRSGEFTIRCSQNAEADITKENLQNYDIVAFYTTGKLPIAEADIEYLLGEWLHQKGHGYMGFHSATDTYKDYEPYWDLSGGTFNGHPWGSNTPVTFKIHDTDHPAMKPFGGDRLDFKDEIYQYSNWQPEKCHVLMSLDMEHTKLKRPYHVPVAWCKNVGDGKMFYNNMGHREDTWQDERILQSIVGAVRWIAGKEKGSAEPNPEVSAAHHEHSKKHAEAAGQSQARIDAEKKAKQERAAARRAARAAKEKAKAAAAGN